MAISGNAAVVFVRSGIVTLTFVGGRMGVGVYCAVVHWTAGLYTNTETAETYPE